MVSSRRELVRALCLVFAASSLSCSEGVGKGFVTGVVSAESCGISPSTPFDLHPDFFVAEAFQDSLNIRIQHGDDQIDYANVLFITVTDATSVANTSLGVPLEVDDQVGSPVRMSLSLNQTCNFHNRTTIPVSYQAVSGTITFSAIYAPNANGNKLTEATFDSVHLIDPSAPSTRYADISGSFQFQYTRGRPAQVFP